MALHLNIEGSHLGLPGVVPVHVFRAFGVEGDGNDGALRMVVGLEAVDRVRNLVGHPFAVIPLRAAAILHPPNSISNEGGNT